VLSTGEHGDTEELLHDLKPLLEQYNVDVYLCGHGKYSYSSAKRCTHQRTDHSLQDIYNADVTYFVNGNAARTDGKWSVDIGLIVVSAIAELRELMPHAFRSQRSTRRNTGQKARPFDFGI
jgi:hypothetical protein